MNENLIRDGRHTFLRIPVGENFEGGFELRMILHNQPERLVKMSLNREGHDTCLDYNVTGLTSIAECGDEAGTFLYAVISGLKKAGESLGEHLLSPDRLSLRPEHVFVRRETGQVYFCYVPDGEGCFQKSLAGLMEFFLKAVTPTDPKEILLLYGLYRKSREESATPATLAAFWQEEKARAIEEEELPTIEDVESGFPEDDLYRELGLERPKKTTELTKRESRRQSQETTADLSKREPRRRPSEAWAALSHGKQREKKAEKKAPAAEETGKDFASKLKALWEKRKTEIVVGALLLIGAILILVK